MKKAQAKSLFIVLMMVLVFSVSVLAFKVNLNYPSGVWVRSNSVPFNFTPVSGNVSSVDYCELYANNTGSFAFKANFSNLPVGVDKTFGLFMGNSSTINAFGWNVTCYDFGVQNSSVASFGVDAEAPTVSLDYPPHNSYFVSGLNFSFTPVDPTNPGSCTLNHNISGTFRGNNTYSLVSGTQVKYRNGTPSDGKYIWNVNCSDTSGQQVWPEPNRSFIIDSAAPGDIAISSPVNNTVDDDASPEFVWNQTTEPNFDFYRLWVSTSSDMQSIVQTVDVSSISSVRANLSNLANGTYYVRLTAQDLAGNQKNSTGIWYYVVDTFASDMSITLNTPQSNNYSVDSTPDFSVTVQDANPSACRLWLSPPGSSSVIINETDNSIADGSANIILPDSAMADGVYQFNIECNNSNNEFFNVSSSLLNITVDTVSPTVPNITSSFNGNNISDSTPELVWRSVGEVNFRYFNARAIYMSNNSLAQEFNVTSNLTLYKEFSLTKGYSYNWTVFAYDWAGNSAEALGTTQTRVSYIDPICSTLNPGWNVCGAVWTSAKNLTQIGFETNATLISVFNKTHEWATCNYQSSAMGQHCNSLVNIDNLSVHAVWIYVNKSTEWQNRTWAADKTSANIVVSNASTIGWNLDSIFYRNGLIYSHIKNQVGVNISLMNAPLNNGTSSSYINKGNFRGINNNSIIDYGRGLWMFYNGSVGTANTTNQSYHVTTW